MNITLKERADRLKSLSISESMKLQASLIDDLVQIYLASLKRKYPDATFQELIQYGHKETYYKIRRREYND
ncbi:MAG: hypothetical protein GF308_20075 [Candidatus Heimdallarchaeota archaeon]|nr:hypothetical protein [Candidatus Heimdallarchaeota archaeon]